MANAPPAATSHMRSSATDPLPPRPTPMMKTTLVTKPTLEATFPNTLAKAQPAMTTKVRATASPIGRAATVPSPMARDRRTVAAPNACHRDIRAPPESAMPLFRVPIEITVAGPISWTAAPTIIGTVMRMAIRTPRP